ncbi:MAG: acylphosphatase [Erysipelotrichaceae bacterium]|nr:acylphosphatase [Erysipelotrichaceae bacterium]
MKNRIRKHLVFYGEVQGVGFRFQAQMAANQLGLTGWVRNEYDGSVTMEVQGTEEEIDKAIEMIGNSRFIHIERIESQKIPLEERESSFRASYWY